MRSNYVRPATFALMLAGLVLAGCSAQRTMTSELRKVVEAKGFALYEPFRADDKPGTIFVYAKDHKNVIREFTVSSYQNTFDESAGQLWEDPKPLPQAEEIKSHYEFGVGVAAEVASMFVNAEFAADYVKDFTLTLNSPQTPYIMEVRTVKRIARNVDPDTKRVLMDYQRDGMLDAAFMIQEALQVEAYFPQNSFEVSGA